MDIYHFIIPVLAFVSVVTIGAAVVGAVASRRDPLQARLKSLQSHLAPPVQEARAGGAMAGLLGRVGTTVSPGKASRSLQDDMIRAGFYSTNAASMYLGAKFLLLAWGLLCLLALAVSVEWGLMLKLLTVGGGASACFFLPNAVVAIRRSRRTRAVRYALPDVVDLLEVCVSSGMSLDQAWVVVSDEIRRVSSTLADEMTLTNLEIHLGAERVAAMRHLCERTGVDEIGSLVAVLVQSEKFGTSVADALKAFASSMRDARSTRAQEAAEATAVRLLFPMILFIFPALLVVVVGPAAITMARMIFAN